jgi:hypothetical protein
MPSTISPEDVIVPFHCQKMMAEARKASDPIVLVKNGGIERKG